MLLGAVSVLVVIASGDPGDGSTRAIEQALHTALGADAEVAVKASPRASAAQVAMLGEEKHAGFLCIVTWSEHRRRVVLRFARTGSDDWSARELRFEPEDAPNERGRTVGFALASMLPEDEPARPPESPPRADASSSDEEKALFASLFPPAERPQPRAYVPPPNPLAIDAVGIATAVPDGYGSGVGGAFALRVPLVGALGLHGAFSARTGSLGPAAATLNVVSASAGLAWQPWLDARRRWAAGARIDAKLLYLDFDDDHRRTDQDQDADRVSGRSRFVPGGSALAEGTYRFADRAAVVSAVGAEIELDRTDLFADGRRIGAVKPAQIVAELGLRISFP